jgi:hypothetical protein
MAKSLARALQNTTGFPSERGEAQLPDDGFDLEETDPFYCEGTVHTSLYHEDKLTVQRPGPEESSEVLLKQWLGSDAKSEWFPYPDKAVRSQNHCPCPLH